MSWAAGDTPLQITGGGGSRMPWATHWKCNGETPPRNTGGEWKLMVLGYSLNECTGDTPLQEGKQHVSRLLTLMSVLGILLHIPVLEWKQHVLRPLTPLSVPDGNSFTFAGRVETACPGYWGYSAMDLLVK